MTKVICAPRSVKSIGSTEAMMPKPMKLRLPASKIATLPPRLAFDRSTLKNRAITARMARVWIMP